MSHYDIERTLVLLKPDAVQRGLMGEIIGRFEHRGLKIVGMKMLRATREQAEEHYAEHKGKDFYDSLVDFLMGGPIVAMCLEGPLAVNVVRGMVGTYKLDEATPGTIRGDLSSSRMKNLVHASDTLESAFLELNIWFKGPGPIFDLVPWKRELDTWVLELTELHDPELVSRFSGEQTGKP